MEFAVALKQLLLASAMLRRHPVRWLAAILILVLCTCEFGLRRAGYGNRIIVESSARFGWVRIPNQKLGHDENVAAHVNSFGYRDREWAQPGSVEQEAQVLRVAILANSIGTPVRLTLEQSFARVLEQRLMAECVRRGSEQRVVVMNFSSPGYFFEQNARVYEDHIRPFRPDVVILVVNAHTPMPMTEAEDPRQFPLRHTWMRTALYDYYEQELAIWATRGDVLAKVDPDAQPGESISSAAKVRRLLLAHPFDAELLDLWLAMGERILGLGRDLAGRDGLLLLAHLPRVYRLAGADSSAASETVKRYSRLSGERRGVGFVDLAPDLYARSQKLFDELLGKQLLPTDIWRRKQVPATNPDDLQYSDRAVFFFDNPEHLTALGHLGVGEGLAHAIATRIFDL